MAGEPILIVEDNPSNLKLAKVLLVGEGYQVKAALDAEEALETLKTFQPAVILMDIQLPGIDGLELTKMIRANPKTADIVIIAITAYAMKGDREKALAAGCNEYISKPINTDTLPKLIANLINKKPSNQ